MKLSFVIPAYNEEASIGICLDSILKEVRSTACEAEIIVVNNASTDRTREAALAYESVRVVDELEKGIVKARQAGYRAATGQLIANIDADNMLPPGWVTRVLSEFGANEKLAALSGPLVYYDLPILFRFQVRMFYYLGYFSYLVNHYLLKKGGMLQGGNFVVRKSALDAIGGFDTSIDFYGEDTDVARRMQQAGRVKFTFSLPMNSSGRRMVKEGLFTTGCRYAMNYLWVLIFKRPFTTESTDIRLAASHK
ncbi:MAG TPA: glycosyltransferase family 2 protein [Syntrophorhabdaceae bacterium]|nr:glycosyltransferase family 2 protein [Syntrophorhabdaceae bacterium]